LHDYFSHLIVAVIYNIGHLWAVGKKKKKNSNKLPWHGDTDDWQNTHLPYRAQ